MFTTVQYLYAYCIGIPAHFSNKNLIDFLGEKGKSEDYILCREGYFLLPYNESAIAQGPKIQQKNKL